MVGQVYANDPLLDGLNDAQREAVTHGSGPLLVVAGAGTGKTRVIVRRVAWVVAHGTPAPSVLAITFTNKAATVLKERLHAIRGTTGVVAGTFHAFGSSLLRRYGDRIGIDRSFTILDSDDQERLLRDLLSGRALPSTFSAEALADAISHRKNGGAGRTPRLLAGPEDAAEVERLEAAYTERLRAAALCDFDDLLVLPRRLLLESQETAESVRRRLRHVLVDEYQDTNRAQAELLQALLGEDRNLFATGDPDQSIYRWRGATIRNILEFHADFPGARRVTLEQNYRSTQRILAAAEAVIASNRHRYEKTLRTENAQGEPMVEVRCTNATDEAAAIASTIVGWLEDGADASEVAVVFRANHLSRAIELALHNAGVPYRMVSGVEFFRRQEVKDVLAYARLVHNPKDDAAFLRVANVPRRGVGDGSIDRLRARATETGTSLSEAAAGEVPGLAKRAKEGLASLLATLARLREVPRAPVAALLQAVLEETKYREAVAASDDDVERSRVANVDELVAAADEADRTLPDHDLRQFLERASLVADQDAFDPGSGRVSLMTAHAAKGLEFDRVVIAAAEEGSFPHERSSHAPDEVEEERRLFYVAMTRARARLVVTHADWRPSWQGTSGRRRPSRFLDDVPAALVEVVDRTGLPDAARSRRDLAWSKGRTSWGVPPEAGDADAVYEQRQADLLRPGDRVSHVHYGAGRVAALSGSGAQLRVTVDFDDARTRTILWEYACLTRLPDAPETR